MQEEPQGGGRGYRYQRPDQSHQGPADQNGDHGDHAGYLDRLAHDARDQEIVLGQPVADIEAQGGDGHRERHRQRDQGDHHPADGGADHRDQVEQGDEQPEQQRVRDPPGDHPQVGADPRDHRGEQVAKQEAANLAQDLIADQDDPGAPGVRASR